MLYQARKNPTETIIVDQRVFTMDQDVIHMAYNSTDTFKDFCHGPLKDFWSRGNTKWQPVKAVPTKWRDECCQ
jgi:hypothetical protein